MRHRPVEAWAGVERAHLAARVLTRAGHESAHAQSSEAALHELIVWWSINSWVIALITDHLEPFLLRVGRSESWLAKPQALKSLTVEREAAADLLLGWGRCRCRSRRAR